jgi:hypothetical protein
MLLLGQRDEKFQLVDHWRKLTGAGRRRQTQLGTSAIPSISGQSTPAVAPRLGSAGKLHYLRRKLA